MLPKGGVATVATLVSSGKTCFLLCTAAFLVQGYGLPVFSFVDSGGDDPGGAAFGGVVRLDGVPCVLVFPSPLLRPDTSARFGGVPCVLVCPSLQLRPDTAARLECALLLRFCPFGVRL